MRPSISLLLLCSLPLAACSSTTESPAQEGFLPVVDSGLREEDQPDTIGFLLTQLDRRLSTWNSLRNEKRNEGDAIKIGLLKQELQRKTRKEMPRLIRTLETDEAQKNREVAAAALGFTNDLAALSPLLAALGDKENTVIQKALFGLGILASDQTPTPQISYILTSHPDPITRLNAAFALHRVVQVGVTDPDLLPDCRSALFDTEAGVRVQAASMLGMLKDTESVDSLGDLLTDKVNLVAEAAVQSLSTIALAEPDLKSKVARLLVDAYERSSPRRRPWIRQNMAKLAGTDYGPELGGWIDWAFRLP